MKIWRNSGGKKWQNKNPKFFQQIFTSFKCKNQKNFEKKISWYQMIQNCIIRREMATKKVSAENGGFRRERRLKPPKPKNKTQVLSRITFNVSLKIKPDNQMYANVSDPPLDIPHFFGILLCQVSIVGNTKGWLHANCEPDPAQTGRDFYKKKTVFPVYLGVSVYQAPSWIRPNIFFGFKVWSEFLNTGHGLFKGHLQWKFHWYGLTECHQETLFPKY